MDVIVLDEQIERRDIPGVECPKCRGFAKSVEPTTDEIKRYQRCGRSWACCLASFVCVLCGQRIVANQAAPEMESF